MGILQGKLILFTVSSADVGEIRSQGVPVVVSKQIAMALGVRGALGQKCKRQWC